MDLPIWQLAVALALTGCGLGWVENTSGGSDHLPTRGAGPYTKVPIDQETLASEPYVISVFQVNLREPSALRRDDGGYRLWFGYDDDPGTRAGQIWTAELASLVELPEVGPKMSLLPDQSWEQSWIGAPCVVKVSDNELVMFYQGGSDSDTMSIGRADSTDGGVTWEKYADNPLLTGYGQPAAGLLPDGRWILFMTSTEASGIFRAQSDDGRQWSVDPSPVLRPRPGVPDAHDRAAVSSPWLIVRETVTGHTHYGLFFNGLDRDDEDGNDSIGWAGSFDGVTWQRFSNGDSVVLEPGGISEKGPSALVGPDGAVLFFSQTRQGTESIAAAVHP